MDSTSVYSIGLARYKTLFFNIICPYQKTYQTGYGVDIMIAITETKHRIKTPIEATYV